MYWVSREDEEEEQLEQAQARMKELHAEKGDYWQVDLTKGTTKGTLPKHHVKKRKALFCPEDDRTLPVKIDRSTRREIFLTFQRNQCPSQEKDGWTKAERKRRKYEPWKGQTTFFLKEAIPEEEKQAIDMLAAERKRSDEVDMKKESEQDLQECRVADAAEWHKMATSGGVRVLSLEESRQVMRHFQKKGRTNRAWRAARRGTG